MATNSRWTREQLLVALKLYCHTDFGKLHRSNPEVIRLAGLIGRTPSALAMKACNFASLDPAQRARGVKGLSKHSNADRRLWNEFIRNTERVAAESEEAYEQFVQSEDAVQPLPPWAPEGPTEELRITRVRRVQNFFRQTILISYASRCALTGITIPELLIASHIIPWHVDETRRADPHNGLCLNALHDRAFDRGFLTFDQDYRAVVSRLLRVDEAPILHRTFLLEIEGKRLDLPTRFEPDDSALEYHREHVFKDS